LKGLGGFDLEKLDLAIQGSWSFQSSIPFGYGLGSSGALTAAAYDYFFKKIDLDHLKLKDTLSEMESFFHGKSSGLDPLTSFLNNSILIYNSKIHVLSDPIGQAPFFLLDSKMTRESKVLIDYFKNQKETVPAFNSSLALLNEKNQLAISSLLCQNIIGVEKAFEEISKFQFEYFQRMIPEKIKSIWEKGLETREYFIKLSGAGGGGFFLGFVVNRESEIFDTEELILL